MTRKLLLYIPLGLFFTAAFALCGSPVYFARSIHGTVADAETGQPIEGAVVVAMWIPSSFHGHVARALVTREVTTDSSGHYAVPWWGPQPTRPLQWLDDYDPLVVFFKHGYEPIAQSNVVPLKGIPINSVSPVRSAYLDGKTVQLKPFRGTAKERLRDLETILGISTDAEIALPRLHQELQPEGEVLGSEGKRFLRRTDQLVENMGQIGKL